jgi:hypothetical protein
MCALTFLLAKPDFKTTQKSHSCQYYFCLFSSSFFFLSQVFSTLYSFLVYTLYFFRSILPPTGVHRPNFYFTPSNIRHHSFSPFFDLSLHIHFVFPPHALNTFHLRASFRRNGHCTMSDTNPPPSLITPFHVFIHGGIYDA